MSDNFKKGQEKLNKKRKIPIPEELKNLNKNELLQKLNSEEIKNFENKNKNEIINYLLRDNEKWKNYKKKIYEREKNAAEFQKNYAKDFNTSISILQEKDLNIPRNQPYTKGGPMKVQYLKYCGSGKKIEFNANTGTWTCEKDSFSQKNENFNDNYGEITKSSLRERSLEDLSNMAKTNKIKFVPYIPSRNSNLDKKEL